MLRPHFSKLISSILAKQMLEEQVSNNWAGLAREVSDICESLRIENPRVTEKERQEYSRIVKEAYRWADEANMKS